MSNIKGVNDYLVELQELSRTFKLESQKVMMGWQGLYDLRPKIANILNGHREAARADGSIQDALSKVKEASEACEAAADAVVKYIESLRG